MARFDSAFDATTVEPNKPFDLYPPGRYLVQIVQSEMRVTKDGQGQYLWLELDILDGELAGRKMFDRLNLINNNPTTVEIAQRTLSAICHAVGQLQVQDSEQLHLCPMIADVKVQPPKKEGFSPSNVIRYLPVEQPGAQPAAAPARAPAPRPAAPAPTPATVPAPHVAAAARPTTNVPPWKRQS